MAIEGRTVPSGEENQTIFSDETQNRRRFLKDRIIDAGIIGAGTALIAGSEVWISHVNKVVEQQIERQCPGCKENNPRVYSHYVDYYADLKKTAQLPARDIIFLGIAVAATGVGRSAASYMMKRRRSP